MRFIAMVLGVLGLVAGCDLFAADFDHRPIRASVARDLEDGKALERAESTFDAMFYKAAVELRKKDRADLAERLLAEWDGTGRALLTEAGLTDVGDHSPFSIWVATWYAKLESVLGVRIMELTHLRDIWVINYTLPVVFRPSADSRWCLEHLDADQDDCQSEYRRHFAGTTWQRQPDPHADDIQHHGFAGVVTYWAVWAGCQAAGGSLACGLAGTGAEFLMERYVAPRLSDRIFLRVNADQLAPCDCCDDCEHCNCPDCHCPHCHHDDEAIEEKRNPRQE